MKSKGLMGCHGDVLARAIWGSIKRFLERDEGKLNFMI